jgi:Helix-turn-helix
VTEAQVLQKVKRYVANFESQKLAAAALDISPQHLSDILSGRRAPAESLLAAIGVKRALTYQKA